MAFNPLEQSPEDNVASRMSSEDLKRFTDLYRTFQNKGNLESASQEDVRFAKSIYDRRDNVEKAQSRWLSNMQSVWAEEEQMAKIAENETGFWRSTGRAAQDVVKSVADFVPVGWAAGPVWMAEQMGIADPGAARRVYEAGGAFGEWVSSGFSDQMVVGEDEGGWMGRHISGSQGRDLWRMQHPITSGVAYMGGALGLGLSAFAAGPLTRLGSLTRMGAGVNASTFGKRMGGIAEWGGKQLSGANPFSISRLMERYAFGGVFADAASTVLAKNASWIYRNGPLTRRAMTAVRGEITNNPRAAMSGFVEMLNPGGVMTDATLRAVARAAYTGAAPIAHKQANLVNQVDFGGWKLPDNVFGDFLTEIGINVFFDIIPALPAMFRAASRIENMLPGARKSMLESARAFGLTAEQVDNILGADGTLRTWAGETGAPIPRMEETDWEKKWVEDIEEWRKKKGYKRPEGEEPPTPSGPVPRLGAGPEGTPHNPIEGEYIPPEGPSAPPGEVVEGGIVDPNVKLLEEGNTTLKTEGSTKPPGSSPNSGENVSKPETAETNIVDALDPPRPNPDDPGQSLRAELPTLDESRGEFRAAFKVGDEIFKAEGDINLHSNVNLPEGTRLADERVTSGFVDQHGNFHSKDDAAKLDPTVLDRHNRTGEWKVIELQPTQKNLEAIDGIVKDLEKQGMEVKIVEGTGAIQIRTRPISKGSTSTGATNRPARKKTSNRKGQKKQKAKTDLPVGAKTTKPKKTPPTVKGT